MSNVASKLRLKYSLTHDPSYSQIRRFRLRLHEYIALGDFKEEAGEKAAKECFPDYHSFFYRSQTDTIEMLLREIASELGS